LEEEEEEDGRPLVPTNKNMISNYFLAEPSPPPPPPITIPLVIREGIEEARTNGRTDEQRSIKLPVSGPIRYRVAQREREKGEC
jgi:hypothetical protein